MLPILVFLAAAVVLAVCVLLVLHPSYHAGLVGNLGLAMVALAAASRCAAIAEHGREVYITPQGVVLWIGLALFLGRHAWKFLQRWALAGPSWYTRAAASPRGGKELA